MMRFLSLLLSMVAATSPVSAETLIAARTIRAQTLLTEADLALVAGDVAGALSSVDDAIGLEARVMLYSGRPISASDVAPAAIIDRNQIVSLRFSQGGLVISADGRALARSSVGDVVRVMNLGSKTIVSGVVAPDGTVHVGGYAAN